MTPHTPQFNGIIEGRCVVIKEEVLSKLFNAKLNGTATNIMQAEARHTCELMQNSAATKFSLNIPLEIFYGEKPRTIGSFSQFGRILYNTKR